MSNGLKTITPEPGRPLYATVRDAVREAIDAGEFAPGERLPSTKALSENMEVSLVTVHRAMQELVSTGVLRRGQGKGTYVHEAYGLRGRKGLTYRFGLVFHGESSLADAYHGQIFEGVRQGAHDLGADIVLLRFGEDWRNECHGYVYVNPFDDQLAKPPRPGRRGESRDGRGAPIMVVGATFAVPGVRCVDTDNSGVAKRAVRYLHGLGHRRIAFIGGTGRVSNDRDRYIGFMDACRELKLSVPADHVLRTGGWRLDQAERSSLDNVLAGPDRPTAVFAAGYHFALDVYAACGRAGLTIPKDLSVIGVDDPPSAAHLSPALTTFRQRLIELGRMAADGLMSAIRDDGDAPAGNVAIEAEFVERASCAPAPRNS